MTQEQETIQAQTENPLGDELAELREEMAGLLTSLRRQRLAVHKGGASARDVGATLSELSRLTVQAEKIKERLDDKYREENGIARSGYAIDLEEARIRVTGCLGRLRRCCREGQVSE